MAYGAGGAWLATTNPARGHDVKNELDDAGRMRWPHQSTRPTRPPIARQKTIATILAGDNALSALHRPRCFVSLTRSSRRGWR